MDIFISFVSVSILFNPEFYISAGDSLVAQLVKNPPAMWDTWFWSLGWENPLEKGMATHSAILVWRIPRTVFHGFTKCQIPLSNFHFHFHLSGNFHSSLLCLLKSSQKHFASACMHMFVICLLKWGLSHCRQILYQLSHKGSPLKMSLGQIHSQWGSFCEGSEHGL